MHLFKSDLKTGRNDFLNIILNDCPYLFNGLLHSKNSILDYRAGNRICFKVCNNVFFLILAAHYFNRMIASMDQYTILWAEDDQDDREFFGSAFDQIGGQFNCHFVNNGHEVFDYLNAATPLIILV